MIQLVHVSKNYDRRPALLDLTLEIDKGDFVLLMGPSGAGKTTLLRLLHCAETPDEGQILIQNRNIARLRASEVPYLRRTMGFVFQDFKLLPKKSVYDNVALPLIAQGASSADIRRKVPESLRAVGVEHKRDSRPPELSAGEQQRVAIARAIVVGPMILLADEPTGNMDPVMAGDIVEVFKAINARGTTVVIATHSRQFAQQARCRVITLSHGRIIGEERPIA